MNQPENRSHLVRAALAFLRWWLPHELYETVEGDLIEQQEVDRKRYGNRRAVWRFYLNILRFVRPGILLRKKYRPIRSSFILIANDWSSSWRALKHRQLYTLTSVLGLIIGLTSFALIAMYVLNEQSFDRFHAKADRVFRLRQDRYTRGNLDRQWTQGAWGIGPEMKRSFPEVNHIVMLNTGGRRSVVLSNGDRHFSEKRVYFASQDFFRVFSFPLVKGVDSLVLQRPFTIVLSEATAKKYFGDDDPIGRTIKCNGTEVYEVTGVFRDVPDNTHLRFDALYSFESLLKIIGPAETDDLMSNWGWAGNFTYVELNSPESAAEVDAKLPTLVQAKMGEYLRDWGEDMKFVLQPIVAIHLDSHFKDELEPGGNRNSIRILSAVAVGILLMAWLNYINLATAVAADRANEVGIRKILGGGRAQLVRRYLTEAAIVQLIAALISIALIFFLIPSFSTFVGRQFYFESLASVDVLVVGFAVFLVGIFFSGVFPALILSHFKPVDVIRGRMTRGKTGSQLRKGLVTFQFLCSVILTFGTWIAVKQVHFMQSQSLGFDGKHVVVVDGPIAVDTKANESPLDMFYQQVSEIPAIESIGVSTDVPGSPVRSSNGGVRFEGEDSKKGNSFRVLQINKEFLDAYDLTIVAGRPFHDTRREHWKSALVNEAAMKVLGVSNPHDIIGRRIYCWSETLEIVGVVKDFHQESLRANIDQLILVCDRAISDYYSFELNENSNPLEAIEKVESKFNAAFPGNPFHFFFLDDYFQRQYLADRKFGLTFGLLATVAIIIACLGLFALASYAVATRTKEIGIRKVLGATAAQVVMALSSDFMKLVALANVIGVLLVFWLANQWLQSFAFHIELGWTMLILPVVITAALAAITLLSRSIKIAYSNPSDSLRGKD